MDFTCYFFFKFIYISEPELNRLRAKINYIIRKRMQYYTKYLKKHKNEYPGTFSMEQQGKLLLRD